MAKKILCVGETLIRLSTETGNHFFETPSLQLHYGGAEANVAINLSNLNHQARYFTKVPDHQLGHAAIKHVQKYGVDASQVIFGGQRLGTYYVETGAGARPTTVIYDRANSAIAQIKLDERTVDHLLADIYLLHITGITAALSEEAREMTYLLISRAKQKGVKVSFDMNYRAKLWSLEAAGKFLKRVLPFVDYLSAGKLDAVNFLGIAEAKTASEDQLDYYYQQIQSRYPNIESIYSTLRTVLSTSHNKLQGSLWKNGQIYVSKEHDMDDIQDRIGGGDAFAAGVLHGILAEKDPQYIIDFATAFSVLKHTVNGDVCPFTIADTERMMSHDARVDR